MAQATLQRGKPAAEHAARKSEEAFAATADNVRDLTVTLIDMAQANMEAAFDFARKAASARTPSDIVSLWSAHVPKQLELLSAQTMELTQLGQKLAIRSAPSITPDG